MRATEAPGRAAAAAQRTIMRLVCLHSFDGPCVQHRGPIRRGYYKRCTACRSAYIPC